MAKTKATIKNQDANTLKELEQVPNKEAQDLATLLKSEDDKSIRLNQINKNLNKKKGAKKKSALRIPNNPFLP